MIFRLVSTALLVLIGFMPTGASAQGIFDNPKNLQVLPKDISAADLRNTMRGFALGLGVRCTHCHVGEEGQPLTTYQFDADEKDTKRIAREMLRMVAGINATVRSLNRGLDHEYVEVKCVTCHRGQDRPRMIEDVLRAELEAAGSVEAVIAKYKELRENYYGSHTFNFTDLTLNGMAFGLMGAGRPEDSVVLLTANAEYYPESANVQSALGDAYAASGDLESSANAFRKALELMPTNRYSARRLGEVEAELAAMDEQ